jgi:hypothetical protein
MKCYISLNNLLKISIHFLKSHIIGWYITIKNRLLPANHYLTIFT